MNNNFVQIAEYICPNCKENVFIQIAKYICPNRKRLNVFVQIANISSEIVYIMFKKAPSHIMFSSRQLSTKIGKFVKRNETRERVCIILIMAPDSSTARFCPHSDITTQLFRIILHWNPHIRFHVMFLFPESKSERPELKKKVKGDLSKYSNKF